MANKKANTPITLRNNFCFLFVVVLSQFHQIANNRSIDHAVKSRKLLGVLLLEFVHGYVYLVARRANFLAFVFSM